jgi:Family of unknown function (DUF5681)
MSKKPTKPVDPTDTSHPLYDPIKDPTHPFYEEEKMEGGPKPDPSDEDGYKVGPGFPPNEHKWKKGIPSPYPKGRPKKVHSLKLDVKKLFEDALNEKIEVTIANKKTVLTKLEPFGSLPPNLATVIAMLAATSLLMLSCLASI